MVKSWRRDAKNVLYSYYATLRYIKQMEEDLIWSQSARKDQKYHGGISDPTAVKILHMEKGELGRLKREAAAVKKVLGALNTERRDSRYKLALVEMVYLRRSHTLFGAAAYLGIPERTAHRWISKILEQLAEELELL